MISDIRETLSGSIIFVTGFWFFWWGWRPAGNPCYSWRTWQTSQGEATSGDYNLLFLLSGECIGGNKIDTCPWILAPLWQLVPIFQEGHSRAGKISEIESSKIFKINMVRTFLPVLSWVSFLPFTRFYKFWTSDGNRVCVIIHCDYLLCTWSILPITSRTKGAPVFLILCFLNVFLSCLNLHFAILFVGITLRITREK